MSVREDGPMVLRYFLLFKDKLYFFFFKLELKCAREGGTSVPSVDVLKPT